GDVTACVIPPAALTQRGDCNLVGGRTVHRPRKHGLPADDANQRAPERNTANEGLRPIDRIDEPTPRRRVTLSAEFLSEYRVVRKPRSDPCARGLLSGAIGDRH